MTEAKSYKKVLDFWFKDAGSQKWFAKDENFDDEIRRKFGSLHAKAIKGELWEWRKSIAGRLAELIILDQFSRNIYRDQPEAFAYDQMSLVLAQEALQDENLDALSVQEKSFIYMPFMHSESLKMQDISLRLFQEEGLENNYQFAVEHQRIIERFGRYPHRNKVLNRESTAEEQEYLKTHDGF